MNLIQLLQYSNPITFMYLWNKYQLLWVLYLQPIGSHK